MIVLSPHSGMGLEAKLRDESRGPNSSMSLEAKHGACVCTLWAVYDQTGQ